MISIANHLSEHKVSWDDAAQKAGMSAERLHQVAAGAEATLAEMRRIAKALRLPLSAMAEQSPSAEPIQILFRQTLGQQTATNRSSIEVISSQIRDALSLAKDMPIHTTWLDLFRDVQASETNADVLAQIFRRAFGQLEDTDPFPHLPKVLQDLGVFILFGKDPSVEGVSAIVEGHAFIIVGARTFRPRMLFTLAHELGHLIAHHDNRDQGYAMLDPEQDFEGMGRVPRKSEEKFADAFASALVLPRLGVLKAIKAIRHEMQATGPLGDIEILTLARFFNVGFEVAARRCEQLGLLPSPGARALYQRLVDDHGNPERRADELGLPPREEIQIESSPALIDAAVRRIQAGELSLGRAAELLNVPISLLCVANAVPVA